MLALENLDERSWLVVRIGRQGLSLLGWDGGVALGGLVTTPPSISKPMGEGVRSISSKSCEDCATHCSITFTAHQVDGPVRLLAVEELWIMDCTVKVLASKVRVACSDSTPKMPTSMVSRDTSKVPPPCRPGHMQSLPRPWWSGAGDHEGRHRHHRVIHLSAQTRLSCFLHRTRTMAEIASG